MLSKLIVYTLVVSLPWLIWIFGAINYYSDYVKSSISPNANKSLYDFIVVGGGAAGAVLTLRLSTSPSVSVLLLEAGGDPSFLNSIPAIASELIGYPETDWIHTTVAQKDACWGLHNNQSLWNAGKVLGGSSTLNFMFYLRGHVLDYQNWANVTGDPQWNFENLLPYFKKSIKSYNGAFRANQEHYSESEYGFLNIDGRDWRGLHDEFREAAEENGFPFIDPNSGGGSGAFVLGVAMIEATQKDGRRHGTFSSVISILEKRKNVKIMRYSHVTKVKFDDDLIAEGVWYYHHGLENFAGARKEVILAAGSVNSPHLLMLSGVGPKEHLKSVEIKPKLDLPVGKNLQDHILVPLFPFLINESRSFVADRDFSGAAMFDFFANGKGPLTLPNGFHSQIFYSSSIVKESGVDWPDIQGFFSPTGVYQSLLHSYARATNTRKEVIEQLIQPYMGSDAFVILLGLVRPKSRGEILLKSSNPFERPLIDPKYLSDQRDLDAMIDGIKKIVETFENGKRMKKLNAHFPDKHILGCENYKLRTDAYWECYARHLTQTIWHPVGTCKMGRANDEATVVDTEFRVLKTKGLRVIDASIMPVIVNANTMAPTIMVAEKGSDFIREHWARQLLVSDAINHAFYPKSKKCFYSHLI